MKQSIEEQIKNCVRFRSKPVNISITELIDFLRANKGQFLESSAFKVLGSFPPGELTKDAKMHMKEVFLSVDGYEAAYNGLVLLAPKDRPKGIFSAVKDLYAKQKRSREEDRHLSTACELLTTWAKNGPLEMPLDAAVQWLIEMNGTSAIEDFLYTLPPTETTRTHLQHFFDTANLGEIESLLSGLEGREKAHEAFLALLGPHIMPIVKKSSLTGGYWRIQIAKRYANVLLLKVKNPDLQDMKNLLWLSRPQVSIDRLAEYVNKCGAESYLVQILEQEMNEQTSISATVFLIFGRLSYFPAVGIKAMERALQENNKHPYSTLNNTDSDLLLRLMIHPHSLSTTEMLQIFAFDTLLSYFGADEMKTRYFS